MHRSPCFCGSYELLPCLAHRDPLAVEPIISWGTEAVGKQGPHEPPLELVRCTAELAGFEAMRLWQGGP